jgi:hypothetical protein
MSENQSGAGLNWRGPLLAAAVFALAFAVLLLMAHQNQSNTTDEGSSFRQDPYGTSLVFDSYQRAGYQVLRSQDEASLAEQNASQTTAFFVGGFPAAEWKMVDGKVQSTGKFRGRLENFLANGGRVVLIQPSLELNSKSQGWDVEIQYGQNSKTSGPAWISPNLRVMPPGSEAMYLSSDAPYLAGDSHWTSLYTGRVIANDASAAHQSSAGNPPAHVYMAMTRVGKGELIAASQESFLLNEAIKAHPNPVLLDFLAGGRPVIWVDETLHGIYQEQGILWLVKRYRLESALLLFWASLLALLWSMGGDLVRRPARDRNAEIVRHGEAAGVAAQRLLQRSVPAELVVAESWDQFRRRSPHDARAISSDPNWGPRLRAALAEPPLSGYKALRNLIAERRSSAKGLAPNQGDAPQNSLAARKKISEEARIA